VDALFFFLLCFGWDVVIFICFFKTMKVRKKRKTKKEKFRQKKRN